MPWGLYRFHQSRLPHFITFTCYRRQSYLNTPESRDALLRVLERTRVRYDFLIYGFVVMPNHMHLLISEPQTGTIATVIQSLKIASARCEKTHICQTKADMGHEAQGGPFWQRRYYDRNVRDHEEFINDLKYIHRNPVKRGLVEKPEDWEWSSYRHYATGIDGIVKIESPMGSVASKTDSATARHRAHPGRKKRGQGRGTQTQGLMYHLNPKRRACPRVAHFSFPREHSSPTPWDGIRKPSDSSLGYRKYKSRVPRGRHSSRGLTARFQVQSRIVTRTAHSRPTFANCATHP